jgi:biotin carboxyl carrier protein
MKRYIVTIDREEYIVEIHDDQVFVNDILAEDSLFSALNDQGLYLIQSGQEKQEIHIQRESQSDFRITVDGHHVAAQIEHDNGRKNRKNKISGTNSGTIIAPMPATIIDVQVQIGDAVLEGQTLLILEAMKMQMKIKSPITGNVQHINKHTGDRVEKGDLILMIDQAKN